VKAHVRLADRRKAFEGDLNILQHEALQWLVIEEADNESNKFDALARFIVLSGMNPQMYKEIWPENQDEEKIEWITPSSIEEAEDLEKLFADLDSMSDSEKTVAG
jgi:hypothetical protein